MACRFVNGFVLNKRDPQYENDSGVYETPVTVISQRDETNAPNDVYETVIDDYETPTTIISQQEGRNPYVVVNSPLKAKVGQWHFFPFLNLVKLH